METMMAARTAGLGFAAALAAGLVLIPGGAVDAQNRPPLQELIALEGTMKQFYRGVNVLVVTTKDGVEHIYHFTKDLIVHGGKKPGIDALEGLHEGTTVVIHYTVRGSQAAAEEIDLLGDEGLLITEGTVTDIDRRKKEITIKFGNGTTETLQMTTRALRAKPPSRHRAKSRPGSSSTTRTNRDARSRTTSRKVPDPQWRRHDGAFDL